MKYLTLAFEQPFTKKKTRSSASAYHLNLALIAMIVSLGFVYLFQINALGTRGYEIRQLEQKITALETDNKLLQLQSSSLSSITKIQELATQMQMVPAGDVTYIKDADFALR